jgi:hypothetical protein
MKPEMTFKIPYRLSPTVRIGGDFSISTGRLYNGVPLDNDVRSFLQRTNVYLSSKQAPSCLAVRAAGTYSVYNNLTDLIERGFPLEGLNRTTGVWEEILGSADEPLMSKLTKSSISNLTKLLVENREFNRRFDKSPVEENDGDDTSVGTDGTREYSPTRESDESELRNRFKSFRILYEDPWLHFRAMRIADLHGLQKPKVNVWFGDVFTIADVLPARLLGKGYTGKSGVEFSRIRDINTKMYFIEEHTHWGHKLREMKSSREKHDAAFAKRLLRRLRALLEGEADPEWRTALDPREDTKQRVDPARRAKRLIEVLCTVDGIFLERYLCYPNEIWTWDRFDRFTLGNLDALIGDEFLDFRLRPEVLEEVIPFYTLLKRQRKIFKMHAHRGTLEELLSREFVHPWMEQFRPVYAATHKSADDKDEYIRLVSILDQTRCCGRPPSIVTLKAKLDTIKTLSENVSPVPAKELSIIRSCIEKLFSTIPDSALSGLSTHATMRVTTAACWEATVSEGGTAHTINELVWTGHYGRKCLVRDLSNGKIVERKTLSECTIGEYIFWISLEEVLAIQPDELGSVWMVMVEDPGKARSVTKGKACLKVIYDVINKLCARLLTKGVESSMSGMEKSNHAWQFFKTLFKPGYREDVFKVEGKYLIEKRPDLNQETFRIKYADVYCGCTDYKEATDQFRFEIAELIGDSVMMKVGIPPLLRGIVRRVSFQPRKIFFRADGPLKEIGHATDTENVRYVISRKGLLMGDPLTKVVLHMQNACTRLLGQEAGKTAFMSDYISNPSDWETEMGNFLSGSYTW